MFPHERSLVERLKDAPFALIGVNSDPKLDEVRPKFLEEKITWRSFWNGEKGTQGPISTAWGIQGWPTLYLIDGEGNVVKKWLGAPAGDELDQSIDATLAKLKGGGAKKAAPPPKSGSPQ